jgi:2-iminobutanoate/2-iminopropanoate deaminase
MAKEVIVTRHKPKFHYSPGIKAGEFVFVAGTVGHENPDTGEKIKGVEAQTHQCLKNIRETLEAVGYSLTDVVSTTVYLPNRDDFLKMNEAYKGYFPKDPPGRTTVFAGLVSPEMLIEIQCVAWKPSER